MQQTLPTSIAYPRTEPVATVAPARAGGRLRYFLHRFARLDVRNMWRLAGLITAEYRIPRIVILVDMAVSSVRFYAGYHDYHEWDWHLLRAEERRTFLTRPQAHQLTRKVNDRAHAPVFTDKVLFNQRFAALIGRDWIDLREVSGPEFAGFVRERGRVMVKSNASLGGDGIRPLLAEELGSDDDTAEALRRRLVAQGQVLVEDFIQQHDDLARLAPASVNTLRVISFLRPDGAVEILARVLKVGHGAPVDNFGSGGMQTMLDPDGRAVHAAFDKEGRKYTVHPETGALIPGTAIPHWDDVIGLVQRAARVVPQVPYVGWDIAVTPEGPILVEGNYESGVFQMKPSISGVRTGLRPRYLEAMGDALG